MSLYDPNEFPAEAPAPKIDTAPSLDFTVADVLAWARTKPADEEYVFVAAGVCAVGQFAVAERGLLQEDADCGDYESMVPPEIMRAANHYDQTFGGFVKRLEALAA